MNLIEFTSLLITKFCHDMAGPLGGLQNGIEFLQEAGGDDAAALLSLSSSEASSRLQIFRNAYGTFAPQSPANAGEAETMVHQFLKHTKMAANINIAGNFTQSMRSVLLQQVLIAHQLMIYGGRLEVNLTGKSLSVSGNAPKMHDDPEIKALLMASGPIGRVANPAPKLVHALYWREYAHLHGLSFAARFEPNQFSFQIQFPA